VVQKIITIDNVQNSSINWLHAFIVEIKDTSLENALKMKKVFIEKEEAASVVDLLGIQSKIAQIGKVEFSIVIKSSFDYQCYDICLVVFQFIDSVKDNVSELAKLNFFIQKYPNTLYQGCMRGIENIKEN
jgi:hypothetical protein